MNVFVLSPGRTATTTYAEAFSLLEGYTSNHESRVSMLGKERINYEHHHIECDNRLIWFLGKLSKKYAKNSILVVLDRDHEEIANSYNQRWRKILIMKSYSQGILLRDLNSNNIDVCRDYVEHCYEEVEYYAEQWKKFIRIDIKNPNNGVSELLQYLDKLDQLPEVLDYIKSTQSNKNISPLKSKIDALIFNFKCLLSDLK